MPNVAPRPRFPAKFLPLRVAAVVTTGIVLQAESSAFACGEVSNQVLYPTNGERDVPTNAQVIAFGAGAVQTLALRKVIPSAPSTSSATSSEASPVDAGRGNANAADASAMDAAVGTAGTGDSGTGGSDDESLYAISEYVALALRCRTRGFNSVCTGSAELEPNTRYAVWLNDPAFTSKPSTFTTGAASSTPSAVPVLDAEVTSVRPGRGTVDCVFQKAGTIEVTFDPSDEPWVLLSGNAYDTPRLVGAGTASVTWETVDPATCFKLEQMNWAGEVIATNEPVCVPEPAVDGGVVLDAAVTFPVDAATPPTDSWELGSVEAGPDDVSPPRTEADAGSSEACVAPAADEDEGCGCHAGARTPSTSASWACLLVLALLTQRRRRR